MTNELFFQTPIGGIPYQNWTIENYVDLDPSPGIQDFRGGNYTYNGHNAIDFTLPHFEAMDNGVPVYASLPGTVTKVHDSEFDRCTIENPCSVTAANSIEIDHGDGLITRYYHLRQDSASVSVGQSVTGGQQIAEVGSSGNSSDAHLHFEVYKNGDVIEVNTPGDEFFWQSPIPYADDVVGSLDHDITDHEPSVPELRERPETVDTFVQQSGITPHLWVHLHGIDQGDDLDFYFSQPDGTEYAHWHWSAPQIRSSWWIAAIELPDEPDLGVWEVEFQHNGSTMLTDTFTVELANIIDGTSGNDLRNGTTGSDRINGFAGNDTINGKAGDDTIDGGTGRDRLFGNDGYDILLGGDGRDFIVGGRGDDLLDGGANNDSLFGSRDADQFVLREGDGLDTIFDYRDGTDSFLLADGLEFEELTITQGFGQSLISVTDTSEDLAVLFGVNANDLSAEDFFTLDLFEN